LARILVVDDEPDLRRLVREWLTDAAHIVVEAANGDEGLRVLQTEGADLVIIDLVMPDKEGIETIREMRQAFPALKIIAISGKGGEKQGKYLGAAEALGADVALAKPFSRDEMVAVVERLLSQD